MSAAQVLLASASPRRSELLRQLGVAHEVRPVDIDESVRPGDVRASFPMRPELVGHFAYGRLHGGVISAVLDAMGGLAAMVGVAERHSSDNAQQVLHRFARLGTIDLRVDFLRPGLGRHFVATADVTRLGGRVGSTQMRLINDEGTLIATGAASYIVS